MIVCFKYCANKKLKTLDSCNTNIPSLEILKDLFLLAPFQEFHFQISRFFISKPQMVKFDSGSVKLC